MTNTQKKILLFVAIMSFLLPSANILAQGQQGGVSPCDDPDSLFGCLEAPLPGQDRDIQALATGQTPLLSFIAIVINVITGGIVLIGLIITVVGGFIYMTAGGDSGKIEKGKTFIMTALLGIILALTAYLILSTISNQFTSGLVEPKELFNP